MRRRGIFELQEFLHLALSFRESVGAGQGKSIVVARGMVAGLQPYRRFKMKLRFGKTAGRGEKVAKVSVGLGIVWLNANGFAKGGFGAQRVSGFLPDASQAIVDLGHFGVGRDSVLECVNCIRRAALHYM